MWPIKDAKMLRMRLGQWADSLYYWLCCVSCGFNLMGQPKEENNVSEARRRGDAETRRKGRYLPERMSLFLLLTLRLRVSCSIFPALMSPED
jgi:hypothetical protein